MAYGFYEVIKQRRWIRAKKHFFVEDLMLSECRMCHKPGGMFIDGTAYITVDNIDKVKRTTTYMCIHCGAFKLDV